MSETHDIVFIASLALSACIGPDHWQRTRPQPIALSIHLLLKPSSLTQAALSDGVKHSVHYGELCRHITTLITDRPSWDNPEHLLKEVAQLSISTASSGASDTLEAVRVRLELSKAILLADSLVFEGIYPTTVSSHGSILPRTVCVNNLALTPVIGMNPPEREARQRVLVHLSFIEEAKAGTAVDYAAIVKSLAQQMEATDFLTLEKFVLYCAKNIFEHQGSEGVKSVTVRAQKPSALSFAHSSGVEMTRRRGDFVP